MLSRPATTGLALPALILCYSSLVTLAGCSLSSATEEAWFDIDSKGNLLVSTKNTIRYVDAVSRSQDVLCRGREVALLPERDGFLFEREDTIWRFDFEKKTEVPLISQDTSKINWWPAYVQALGLVVFARAENKRPKSMGGLTGESYDVYSCQLDGSEMRRLTEERFLRLSIAPHCAFDDTIYFVGTRLVGNRSESFVYKTHLKTGQTTRIENTGGAKSVNISHDGTRLVFTSKPEYYSIYTLDLNSGERQLVKRTRSEYVVYPVFDQDDNNVLFLEDKDRSSQIRIKRLSLDTKKVTDVWLSP